MTAAKHDPAKPLDIQALLLIARCEGAATMPRDFEAHGGLNSTSHYEDRVTGLFSQEGNSDGHQRNRFAKLAWSLLSRLTDPFLSWEPIHPLHLIL